MSPKNQVHPLSYLCVKLVSWKLTEALADEEGRNYDAVRKYFLDATYEVIQEVLKHVLNSVNLDAGTRFCCLQVLLRGDVKKLDTGIFPHSYYEEILEVITQKGTGLTQLNLKGVWVREYPEELSKLIRSLTKMKVLIIPHMADDQVLEATRDCDSLSFLDISGECSFTSEGLHHLPNTLTVLDIGYYGKRNLCLQDDTDVDMIAEILPRLPNLTSLKTYSFTGSSLLAIFKKNSNFKTRLKYIRDTWTSHEIMEAIIHTCENLESIYLDSPEKEVLCKLSSLKKLSCTKLVHYDGTDLLAYLETSGNNSQVLKLHHNKTLPLNLSDISAKVPQLQTLECFQLAVCFPQMDTFFMNLENIEILYCDINDSSLRNILTNCPFLRRVIVGCVINMTDGDIFRLCAECDFLCLEELWLSCARCLTSISVELLMGHCPNLRVIGQLSGWDIHPEEIEYLRSVILYTNTDLTLLPLGRLA